MENHPAAGGARTNSDPLPANKPDFIEKRSCTINLAAEFSGNSTPFASPETIYMASREKYLGVIVFILRWIGNGGRNKIRTCDLCDVNTAL